MFAMLAIAGPAALLPLLLGAPFATPCAVERLTYASADDRALSRFTAATHDYVAYGKENAIFTAELADLFRFKLEVARWLHRHEATHTLSDAARAGARRGHRPAYLAVLPPLPGELEYRLAGPHLLLVDRRTHGVVDLMTDVLREHGGEQ